MTRTKTLTMFRGYGATPEFKAAIPCGVARLLGLAVHYYEWCPADVDVTVWCTWPVAKTLLTRANTNVDLPLSPVTEPEVDTAGEPRTEPATVHPLVGGTLRVDVVVPEGFGYNVLTVTAVVEV